MERDEVEGKNSNRVGGDIRSFFRGSSSCGALSQQEAWEKFLRDEKAHFPGLCVLVRLMLVFECNTGGVERVHGETARIKTRPRNRLHDKTLCHILQIRLNKLSPQDLNYVDVARKMFKRKFQKKK